MCQFSSAVEMGVDWGIREAGGAIEKEECTNVIALGSQEEDFGTSRKGSIEVILKFQVGRKPWRPNHLLWEYQFEVFFFFV